VSWFYLTG